MAVKPDHFCIAWFSAISNRSPSCGHSGYGGAPHMAQLASTSGVAMTIPGIDVDCFEGIPYSPGW